MKTKMFYCNQQRLLQSHNKGFKITVLDDEDQYEYWLSILISNITFEYENIP